MDEAAAASVTLDVSAFRREADGIWTVTEDTMIEAGIGEDMTALLLSQGARFGRGMYSAAGIDLVELLERKRAPAAADLAH